MMRLPALDALDTFPKLLLHNAANWPNEPAMREKELGIWHVTSWAGYRDQVRLVALGLAALGVQRGEVIGLIGRNRPNWVWGELAAHALGCMSLGIYEDVLGPEAGY
ncbi:MAG: AMP-binding protein, partial [Geminicoccaceae bacterium]